MYLLIVLNEYCRVISSSDRSINKIINLNCFIPCLDRRISSPSVLIQIVQFKSMYTRIFTYRLGWFNCEIKTRT